MPGPERLLHLIALYAHEAKHYLIALIPSAIPVCFYIFWKVGVKKAALAPTELEELNSSASLIGRSVFKQYWPLAVLLPAASLIFMLCDLNDDAAWRHSVACDIISQLNLPVQGMLVATWLSLTYKAWAKSKGQKEQVAIDKLIVLGFSIAFSRLLFGYARKCVEQLFMNDIELIALFGEFAAGHQIFQPEKLKNRGFVQRYGCVEI